MPKVVGTAGIGAPIPMLSAYLEAQIAGFGPIESVERFAGGQSNPTFKLITATRPYVLRRKPTGHVLPSAHAVDREYRVLKALSGTPVPVPQAVLYCGDTALLGSPFYVMQCVAGHIYWDARLPDLSPAVRRRIYDEMVRVMAALHAQDPAGLGLADFGRPGSFFERQIRRWTEQYRSCETKPRPSMELLIEWLPRNLPRDDGQVAIIHGDYRLDNLVFDASANAAALLDWELSTLGHPIADLAYQCAQWRLPPGTMRGLQGVDRASLGLPTEAEYVEQYCRLRRIPPIESWQFYLAISLFRLASICQGVYRRGLDGNASGADALDFDRRTDIIAECAAAIASTP